MLTLVTTKTAVKLKVVEAKLEILYLVNSSKIFLKLLNLILTIMLSVKCLVNF